MPKIVNKILIIIGTLGSLFFMLDMMNLIDAVAIIDKVRELLPDSMLVVLSGIGSVIVFYFYFCFIKDDAQSIFDVFKKEKKEKNFEEREHESRYGKNERRD